MKKSDLKTGMICQSKDGRDYLVVLGCNTVDHKSIDLLIDETGWMPLSEYTDDLTYNGNIGYDIESIYSSYNSLFHLIKEELIWKRKPEKIYKLDGVEYSESTLRSLIKKATE